MLLELLLLSSLILPGMLLIKIAKIRFDSTLELLAFSYLLSLALIFGLLYIGGISNSFGFMSLAFLLIAILSLAYFGAILLNRVVRSLHRLKSFSLQDVSTNRLVLVLSTIGLLAVFAVVLGLRPIFDSDVAQLYLPLAREIVITNGFTYGTGYDYVVFLKPIGVSVLYAWGYVVSGSLTSEAFRFMPLIPVLMMVVLNYQIASSVTKSKKIGLLASAIFIVLPFQDRLLLYNAFYPDAFYYPLVFMVIYLLIKYNSTRDNQLLCWAGLSLGVASLLKAQAIYFLTAILVVVIVLELKSKILSFLLCILAPILILVPNILIVALQRQGVEMFLPSLNLDQQVLLIFASALSGVGYLLVYRKADLKSFLSNSLMKNLIKKIIAIVVPFSVFFCLWYLNNLVRFGTLIYTSSVNLPNYDWALGILKSVQPQQSVADFWHYAAYFMFIFVHPAVMGYIMLVPFIIGLIIVIKKTPKTFRAFFVFEIVSASIVISNVVISIPSGTLGYNPRDILPLAPLLSTLSAIGIAYVVGELYRPNTKSIHLSLVLVVYFGFLNYVHSVMVWYSSLGNTSIFGKLMSTLASLSGLNLEETSFQFTYSYGTVFVGEYLLNMILLSLLAGIPVLVLATVRRQKSISRLGARFEHTSQGTSVKHIRSRELRLAKGLIVVSLLVSVIMVPRVGVSVGQGSPQQMPQAQLRAYYGAFYDVFALHFEGDILTYDAPQGTPYYLPGIKIVDLQYAGNLATLRDCFQSNSSIESAARLRVHGIRYILISPDSYYTQLLDLRLNNTIANIIQDPTITNASGVYGSWQLYDIGL